jgi:hypothetical protein
METSEDDDNGYRTLALVGPYPGCAPGSFKPTFPSSPSARPQCQIRNLVNHQIVAEGNVSTLNLATSVLS